MMIGAVDHRQSYGGFKFTSCFAGGQDSESSSRTASAQLKGAPGTASYGNMEVVFYDGNSSSNNSSVSKAGGRRMAARPQEFPMNELGSSERDSTTRDPSIAPKAIKTSAVHPINERMPVSSLKTRALSPREEVLHENEEAPDAHSAEPSNVSPNAVYHAFAAAVEADAQKAQRNLRPTMASTSLHDDMSALSLVSSSGKRFVLAVVCAMCVKLHSRRLYEMFASREG